MCKRFVSCITSLLMICVAFTAAAQQTVRNIIPIDLNSGGLRIDSYVYVEDVLIYTFQDRLYVKKGSDALGTETFIPDLTAEAGRPSDKNVQSKRYRLSDSGSGLLLLDIENGLLYGLELDGESVGAKLRVSLDWEDYLVRLPDGGAFAEAPVRYCAAAETLFAIEGNRGEEMRLASFSLEDGRKSVSADMNVMAMTRLSDGALLLAVSNDKGEIFIERLFQGETTPWTGVNRAVGGQGEVFGIAYDGERNVVFLGVDHEIRKIGADGASEIVVTLPDTVYMKEGLLLTPAQTIALLTNIGLLEFGLTDGAAARHQTLTVWGNTESPEMTIGAMSVSGLSLQSVEPGTYEMLLQNLIARNEDVDIYRLSLSNVNYHALKEKGYYTNLASSESIQAFFNGLYPSIRNMLGRDGEITAVPIRAEIDGMAQFDQSFFESEHLAVPQTFEEMCAVIGDWDARYAEAYDDIQPLAHMTGTRRALIAEALRSYLAMLLSENSPTAAFESPLLYRILSAVEAASSKHSDTEYKSACVFEVGMQFPRIADFRGMLMDGRVRRPLAMSLAPGKAPSLIMRLDVLVVNPFSVKKELAVRYLEKLIEALPAGFKMMVSPDLAVPIENPDFSSGRQRRVGEIELLASQIDKASGVQKTELEERMAMLKDNLARYEAEERYQVSLDDIACYRKAVGDPVIEEGSLLLSLQSAMRIPMLQYADGAIGMEQFMREVEAKWKLIRSESE